MQSWNDLKKLGSAHYKSGGKVEPIDLYASAHPHPSYNIFGVKALTDVIKYAFRLLVRGWEPKDADKIIHYMNLLIADMARQENQDGSRKEDKV